MEQSTIRPAVQKRPAKLKRYHFSLGDSAPGAVGYCAEIVARSEAEAVARLKLVIERVGTTGVRLDWLLESAPPHGGDATEYLRLYLNPDAISASDIDDSPADDDGE